MSVTRPSSIIHVVSDCLRGRLPESVDWVSLLNVASNNWLVPAMHVAFEESEELGQLPDDVASFLKIMYDRNYERNRRLRYQLVEIVATLNRAGIEPVLTKGSIHLFTAPQKKLGSRMMSDLDLLVFTEEVRSAEDCFVSLGYERIGGLGWARAVDAGMIDLHYPPGKLWKYFPSQFKLLAETNRFSLDGTWARIPSPSRQIIHMVLHDQIKEGDWWLASLDLRHMWDLVQIIEASDRTVLQELSSAMPDWRSRDALESQLLTARKLFSLDLSGWGLSHTILPYLQHRRQLFQAEHSLAGVPFRIAGYPLWALRRLQLEWENTESISGLFKRAVRSSAQTPLGVLNILLLKGRGPKI